MYIYVCAIVSFLRVFVSVVDDSMFCSYIPCRPIVEIYSGILIHFFTVFCFLRVALLVAAAAAVYTPGVDFCRIFTCIWNVRQRILLTRTITSCFHRTVTLM